MLLLNSLSSVIRSSSSIICSSSIKTKVFKLFQLHSLWIIKKGDKRLQTIFYCVFPELNGSGYWFSETGFINKTKCIHTFIKEFPTFCRTKHYTRYIFLFCEMFSTVLWSLYYSLDFNDVYFLINKLFKCKESCNYSKALLYN